MKSLSLLSRVIAIVAGLAALFFWFDTKGIIKAVDADLSGLKGETVLEKAAQVQGKLDELADKTKKLIASEASVRDLTSKNSALTSDLNSEQTKNKQLSNEYAKKLAELRSLNSNLDDAKKELAEANLTVETLKKEIIESKNSGATAEEIENLKQKLAAVQNEFDALNAQYNIAKEKARIYDLCEIVEVIKIDEVAGTKTITKTLKKPYVVQGEMAVVRKVDPKYSMVALNKGTESGIQNDQKIALKYEGDTVAEVVVIDCGKDYAICSYNKMVGTPEILAENDVVELVPTIKMPTDDKKSHTNGAM